jgi:hypothetical protein
MPSDARSVLRPPPDEAESRAHRDALEPALLAAFARRGRSTPPPRLPWLRFALAGLVFAGAGAVACQLPTEYERPLGQRIAIVLPAVRLANVDPERLAAHVEASHPIEGLMLRVVAEQTDDRDPGVVRIVMDVVGPEVDIEEVWDDLVQEYPALDGGRVEGEVMEGVVHGTWGGRLGNDLFDLRLDEGDIEDARARLLLDLQAQGVEGHAEITVEEEKTPDGLRRRIEVRVEAEDPG